MEQIITEKLINILGKYSFKAEKGHGSFLTFDFGQPTVEYNETKKPIKYGKFKKVYPFNKFTFRRVNLKGDYLLWIFCTDWKIFVSDIEISHSESKDKIIENAMYYLEGQKIIKIEIQISPTKTIFYFDLNSKLECRNINYDNHDESWFIYDNVDEVLTFRQDGKFNLSKIEENPFDKDKTWFDLNRNNLIIEI